MATVWLLRDLTGHGYVFGPRLDIAKAQASHSFRTARADKQAAARLVTRYEPHPAGIVNSVICPNSLKSN